MILYHGSNIEIVEIDLQKSRPNKDFGRGFYLSADRDQAFRMAQFKTKIEGGNPFVTEYEFDDSFLISGELKVKTFDAYTEEWAQFIFLNRNNREAIQQHDYDIVYNSDTFAKLSDPETGLFFQSPGYVYSYLESEIPKEKVQLL